MNRRDVLRLGSSLAAAVIAGEAVGDTKVGGQFNEAKVEATMLTDLRPGDTLVFKCDQVLSCEAAERLRHILEERFPGNKALVLDGGSTLEVMRGQKALV